MPRTINEAGLNLIKTFEGCRLNAYRDVAGIWTIGYGHTRGVYAGMTFTQQQADEALSDDLRSTELAVERALEGAETTDNQFAALVALSYNIGSGRLASSTILRAHCAGRREEAANAFLQWNKATINGVLQEVNGLTNRRRAERELYLS